MLTVILTPGTTWTVSDDVTAAQLNLTANPTISVSGDTRALSDVSATPGAEGQILIFRVATGKWTPEAIPASTSDTFNRVFAWEHYA